MVTGKLATKLVIYTRLRMIAQHIARPVTAGPKAFFA
jgi:hypothetical protein